MITAIDTSVLLDVFLADPRFGPSFRNALQEAIAVGGLVMSEVVLTEVCALFPQPDEGAEALGRLGVRYEPMDRRAALTAATLWSEYRRRGGRRTRVVADFLIGSHALQHADRLLTRDRGFYRTYFRDLDLVQPTA